MDEATPDGRDEPPEWEVLDAVTEYETGWYTGGYDLVVQPDGSEKRYYWAELPPSVVIVPVVGDEVVFVEQYRPAIRQTQLELPAGIVEPGESFTEASARELREETGFDPSGVSILQTLWVATGVLRHRRGIVFAEGLAPTQRELDSNEFITVRTAPVSEAIRTAREGPTNEATLDGLLLAKEDGLL